MDKGDSAGTELNATGTHMPEKIRWQWIYGREKNTTRCTCI